MAPTRSGRGSQCATSRDVAASAEASGDVSSDLRSSTVIQGRAAEQQVVSARPGNGESTDDDGGLVGDVGREFSRLAQRELRAEERAIALGVLHGIDQWASGHDPEALPTLAVALASACTSHAPSLEASRPLLFLSPEAELLRMRQVRFGARAASWLIDVCHGSFEGIPSSAGVIWCTLESLQSPGVRDALAAASPAALFVESAHAASPLAHEMRPSLALVPGLRTACGDPPLLAFTRAVPDVVLEDAAARLGLSAPAVHRSPLAAPTRISVVPRGTGLPGGDGAELIEEIERLPRPTIVFCSTPQEADGVFARLLAAQIPVHRYHGAMSPTERATEMLHFTLPGRRAVMVATSAFRPESGLAGIEAGCSAMTDGLGLGYCKQKARSLVHCAPPVSLEQYALELAVLQEDEETESVLFADPRELAFQRAWLEQVRLSDRQIEDVADHLRHAEGPIDLQGLQRETGWGRHVVERAVRLLRDVGVVAEGPTGVRATVSGENLLQVSHLLASALLQMRDADRLRLEAVGRFLASDDCRRVFLDGYLGAESTELRLCGRCDVCVQTEARQARSVAPKERPSSRAEGDARIPQRRAPARSWSVAASQTEAPTVVVHKARRSRQAVV